MASASSNSSMVLDEKIVRGRHDAAIFPGVSQVRRANFTSQASDDFVVYRVEYPHVNRGIAIMEIVRPILEIAMATTDPRCPAQAKDGSKACR